MVRTNYGQRRPVRVKTGWENAGRTGLLYFTCSKDENLGQSWSFVLWDDAEDPETFKTAGLEDMKGNSIMEVYK